MNKLFGVVIPIIFSSAFALAAGDDRSMSNLPALGGAKILMAQVTPKPPPPPPPSGGHTKPKQPPKVITVPSGSSSVPGASQATKGQTGRCICSTNAQGSMMCTGRC